MSNSAESLHRACPICGCGECSDAGPILHPSPMLIAGVVLDIKTEFRLKRCTHCSFQFKDPELPADELLRCYAAADSGNWTEVGNPTDRQFDVIGRILETCAPGRRVLDVGCFTGQLLDCLGASWQRFGVEPSRKAAEIAAGRGIAILGSVISEIPQAESFDAITAIDVVEHIADPMPLFRRISSHLRPGGILVLVTGDTGAWSWRVQKSLYWYCSSLPEHVSFYSRQTLDEVGRQVGLRIAEFRRISHIQIGIGRRGIDLAKNLLYVGMRRLRGLGIPSLRRLFVDRRAPSWLSARDQMLCVMRKDAT